jgi:hypothetical protein
MAATTSPAAQQGQTVQKTRCAIYQQWLDDYGTAEYASFKKEAATPQLSYEDWTSSEYALGPYLYRLTLDAWDAPSSSVSYIRVTFSAFDVEAYDDTRMTTMRWLQHRPRPLRLTKQQKPRRRPLFLMELMLIIRRLAMP